MGAIGIGLGCGTSEHSSTGTPADASADGDSGRDDSAVAGDAGALPPSCATNGAGVSDCGASRESCCTTTTVAGGTFYRTYDGVTQFPSQATLASDGGATGVADPATVSDFGLDRYLVTVGRFRAFVSAWSGGNGWLPPPGSGKHTHLNGGLGLANVVVDAEAAFEPGWVVSDDASIAPTDANLACDPTTDGGTWTPAAGGNEHLPINCVNWYEAYAFCIWDGGFLPSEAEWGYAAAGGAEQREYPWGSTYPGVDSEYAIYNCLYPYGPDGSDACLKGVTNFAPVGTASLGAGRWGQLDLAGELLEWNLDFFSLQYGNPCTDCAYLTDSPSTNDRVDRGGYLGVIVRGLYSATRQIFSDLALTRSATFGFRCARTP
jgi:formylglycine-generating enzyme required for sulfatase activity